MSKLARIAAASIAASFLFLPACGSQPETLQEKISEAGDWWNEPGSIRDTLAAVGMANVRGTAQGQARNRAEVDARGKLAAAAKAKVQSLMSNWYKEAGDNLDERTLSSYANDEGLIRQMTDLDLIGARVAKYKLVGDQQYVLMVIDDPAKWTKQVGASAKDRALKDETLFKTEVMKRDFEEKLDKLINKDTETAAKAAEKFQAYVK